MPNKNRLCFQMVVIVFVATLCVTSATAWRKEKKATPAFDAHQLVDGFVVSYELQQQAATGGGGGGGGAVAPTKSGTATRPGTHTSWLSTDGFGGLNSARAHDPAYGSIGSGLIAANGAANGLNASSTTAASGQIANGAAANGLHASTRSIYGGSASVYQALATDNMLPHAASTAPAADDGAASRLGARSLGGGGGASRRTPNGIDYGAYVSAGGLVSIMPDAMSGGGVDDLDGEAFASHYQAANPHEDAYRATWRRTREQAERARTPSRNLGSGGGGGGGGGGGSYAALGSIGGAPILPLSGYPPSRPSSASTSDTPPHGSRRQTSRANDPTLDGF